MCKTGGDRKALSGRAFWALGRELSLALVGFALCRKLKSVEDEYGSRSPAGTLCSSEEIQTRVTGSATRAEVCSVLLLLYQDIEVCGCHGLGLCLS